MEIMWGIPFILEPNQTPPCIMSSHSTSFESKSWLTINLDPGWECQSLPSEAKKKRRKISNQRKKEGKFPIKQKAKKKKERRKISNQRKKERKGNSQSKSGRKKKEKKEKKKEKEEGKKAPDQGSKEIRRNVQKGLWTGQYLYNTELSPNEQKKRERKPWSESGLLPLITNQNPLCRWLVRLAQNKSRKGKGQKHTKAEKPTKRTHSQGKSYWSMITHVIFDLIGNNLQSQVMTYLCFGIRIKHLPVRDWYTLSGFLLFLSNPVFPLNGHLETKC